jgi:N-acetyl-D-muramate 6-phosphate phosphatase
VNRVRCVLFDLDGTLVDTAPDLGFALNVLRREKGLEDLPMNTIRSQASHGARGLIRIGFALSPHHPEFAALREAFLRIYERNMLLRSLPFPGIDELLRDLERQGIAWGVVTNKPARYTEPLLAHLELAERAACIVSGDTCPQPKPHPCPLLTAAEQCGTPPANCLYVGDAERDIEAAEAAGMPALVAEWGYIADDEDPSVWGAHGLVRTPGEIAARLQDIHPHAPRTHPVRESWNPSEQDRS